MLVWSSAWSEVQIVCIWSSWCHCILKAHRLLIHRRHWASAHLDCWREIHVLTLGRCRYIELLQVHRDVVVVHRDIVVVHRVAVIRRRHWAGAYWGCWRQILVLTLGHCRCWRDFVAVSACSSIPTLCQFCRCHKIFVSLCIIKTSGQSNLP